MDEAHLDAGHILAAIERFVRDRESRLGSDPVCAGGCREALTAVLRIPAQLRPGSSIAQVGSGLCAECATRLDRPSS